MEKRRLTKAEAAAKSGASEKTIERKVKAGLLKAQKIHGHLVILEHDLDSFLAQRAAPVGDAGVHAA